MAWSEADQNPSLAPTAGAGSPSYATMLNSYAYGNPSSAGSGPAQTQQAAGRSYAERIGSAAPAQAKQTTSRALEKSAAPKPAATGNYTIQRGDNLTAIGKRFGISVEEIAAANGIRNPNRIRAGQSLVIPTREVNIPTPRPRPSQPARQQVDPGRFDDAFAYAPPPEAMTDVPFDAVMAGGVPTPRMNPRREQPAVQWNIDGALGAMDSEQMARDAGGYRRTMEANQPAYRGGNRQGVNRTAKGDRPLPPATNIDTMTMTDADNNYVMRQDVGGARPEGPAGGMPAARYQPTVAGRMEVPGQMPQARYQPMVAGRQEVPGRLPQARQTPVAASDPPMDSELYAPGNQYGRNRYDFYTAGEEADQRIDAARAASDSRWAAADASARRREMERLQPAYRAPARQAPPPTVPAARQAPAANATAVPPAPLDTETGVYGDPSQYPPEAFGRGPEADARDAMQQRFGDAFSPAGPGMIADLPGAFAARSAPPTITQPQGAPVFVAPNGIRIWTSR